jgi:hypothetical protein
MLAATVATSTDPTSTDPTSTDPTCGRTCIASTCTRASATDRIFVEEQHEAFQRDGFLVISGMMDSIMVQNLDHAANLTVENSPKIPFYFSVTKQGAMFGADAFRQAALFSDLPRAAAELMQLDPETQHLRILR